LPPGEAGLNNILKMAREGLRRELTTALHQVAGTREVVQVPGLQVRNNGMVTRVNLTVRPVAAGGASAMAAPLYLVVLEEMPAEAAPAMLTPPPASPTIPVDTDERIILLKQALWAKEEHLQAANEELETSNEELKSSNEEMQSVNEELQSANEELETSKEELQSVNEELGTVNAELQTKVTDLWQANNDMNNLLAGSGVATVFVDHDLRILRYTPAATRIINLIPSDVGRPVAHVVSNLVGYDRMVADTQAVLDTLMTQEITVQALGNVWYNMRILPYRTQDNVIEGAVITFVEVTALKQAEASLVEASLALDRLAVVVRDASDAITVQDLSGRTLAWNPGAERLYGWTESEALTLNVRDRLPPALRTEGLARIQQLSQADMLAADTTWRLTKQGDVLAVSVISTALINDAGQVYAIATTERATKTQPEPLAPSHHDPAA
jgi:two-component system CheB/CheR fusion protein